MRSIISAEVLEGRIDLSGDIEVEPPAGERLFTFPFEAAFEVRRGAKSGR